MSARVTISAGSRPETVLVNGKHEVERQADGSIVFEGQRYELDGSCDWPDQLQAAADYATSANSTVDDPTPAAGETARRILGV